MYPNDGGAQQATPNDVAAQVKTTDEPEIIADVGEVRDAAFGDEAIHSDEILNWETVERTEAPAPFVARTRQ